MNLPARIGVSLLITAGVWVVGTLVERRVRQLAAQTGVDWPATDVGLEVSPGLMRLIAITDLLHRLRFSEAIRKRSRYAAIACAKLLKLPTNDCPTDSSGFCKWQDGKNDGRFLKTSDLIPDSLSLLGGLFAIAFLSIGRTN